MYNILLKKTETVENTEMRLENCISSLLYMMHVLKFFITLS